jgi:hypothetical protein
MVEKTCSLASTLTPITLDSALACACRRENGTLERKMRATRQARNDCDWKSFRMTWLP